MTNVSDVSSFSPSSLMEQASARCGLDDWGDRAFTQNLERFVESCRQTGGLNEIGWRALRKNVLRCLENRLYLQAYLEAHPEVRSRAITAPVIITGLPRTGTTLLQSLLGLDRCNRILQFWEAQRPVPPDPTNGLSRESLIEEARTWIAKLYEASPDFRAVHSSAVYGPQECDVLFQNEFASWHFEVAFPAKGYSDWLTHASLFREYSYYSLQLRALSGKDDPEWRWVLKSPSHLGQVPALFGALPDATIIHCHRDPLEAIPSFASLVLHLRTPYSRSVSSEEIGRQALRRFSVAMDKALQARDEIEPHRFIDLPYRRLVREPLPVIREIYERLGLHFGSDFEARMTHWLASNPQHKHGVHRYSLEQFGMTADDVLGAFSPYCERFAAAISGVGRLARS